MTKRTKKKIYILLVPYILVLNTECSFTYPLLNISNDTEAIIAENKHTSIAHVGLHLNQNNSLREMIDEIANDNENDVLDNSTDINVHINSVDENSMEHSHVWKSEKE